MTRELSSEFDADFYRARYPDLAAFDDAAAFHHYDVHGRGEGRVASPLAEREGFLAFLTAGDEAPILEIGPFCRPLLRGPQVRYLDLFDADGLRKRATEIGLDTADCPEKIDYVGSLADIDDRFAAIVSSHAVEHQPDLVVHLQEVGRLLEPDGRYYLIVPDKRFCFDALIPESSVANVLYAHLERRQVHSLQSVIEHRAMVTHNDGARHWAGDHGPFPPDEQARRVRAALREFEAAKGGYIDVHAWYWTPTNFRQIMSVLHELGHSPLRVLRVYDTPHPRFEFCAVLGR